MKVGDWYRCRGRDHGAHVAYEILAIGRDMVVYGLAGRSAFYMTKADFDSTHELLVEAPEIQMWIPPL
jgi:hypothetical protein